MTTLPTTATTKFTYDDKIETVTVGASGYYDITADGAQGGSGYEAAAGGLGAMASGEVYFAAGAKLEIVVGGAGGNAFTDGGGGGGGSFVIETGTASGALATPIDEVIAGGGGGGSVGRGGGGVTQSTGGPGSGHPTPGAGGVDGGAGQGETSTTGGGGGGFTGGAGGFPGQGGSVKGVTFDGGRPGGSDGFSGGSGGFGGGGGGGAEGGGGGGGFGGGGGGALDGGGGGGGSFVAEDAVDVSQTGGTNSGNGLIEITYEGTTAPPCYCRGTLILTDRGEVAVEDLVAGDRVVTASGDAKPIHWIGRRSYLGRLAAGNPNVMPVCFKPGALADHVPRRDLWVSPDHAMFLDGALVPAGLLVNARSILKAEQIEEIHYFHIELDAHDLVVAEGALAETFVDDQSRGLFHNAPEYYAEHPEALRPGAALFCAPRLEDGFELEALREKLAGRAARLTPDGTAAQVEIAGFHDAADRKRIAGWAYDAQAPERRVGVVVLSNGAVIARLIADGYRDDLEQAGIGDGRHAFELAVDGALATDRRHEIEIRAADDWRLLPGSPQAIEAEARPLAALGELRGHIDGASARKVSGWAMTASDPREPVALSLSANGRELGRVLANRFRNDLIGVGGGRHGFELLIPRALDRTEAQEIRVRRVADGAELANSPFVVPAAGAGGRKLEAALAEVIEATADAVDEDAALAALTRETETLLARRARRIGAAGERETHRAFRRRWGRAPDAQEDFSEAGLRALVIDERAPCATRDAGSLAILSHMRALQALGYSVSFAALDGGKGAFADEEGIVVHGRPHYSCVEDVLCRHAGNFDLVYLHRLSCAERYLKLARAHHPRARAIYSVADLHHLRLARQARVEQRPELLAFARATERGEIYAASQADLVLTHSPVEAGMLSRHVGRKVRVVPFAVGERPRVPPFPQRRGLAFLGSFEHPPNADAVYWLAHAIMPLVWRQAPELTCKIAGHGWREEALGRLDPRVEIVGPVEDLDDLFGAVRLTVAPLRFGAGIKGKVLESFAAGLPCAMSEIGAEGLALAPPLTDLVARDPAEFGRLILRLHGDEAANADLGARARTATAAFTQEGVTAALREALAESSVAVRALAV